ncbi:beta-galactosidase GalA [Saccharophagus degradans]|uniref:Beta-galactosidase. Glycosyl Hydrolase family 2 n=1 Tax=Saccharophagus degradans (strain 2-40 / ATCC 43961 / DSM 17024) TaxID=203122 RepID=Q21DU2_SACD2|nr:beta-galactosidase GalA [Saccharophagus degradans]ABD83137.1 beta-galactosidase. Glycosyl Hydrolase family 2 [Saccharophagus degradans 2-40]
MKISLYYHGRVVGRLVLLLAVLFGSSAAFAAEQEDGRERLSLNRGWYFHLGDVPMAPIKGHSESYMNAKAGNAPGPAGREFDDSEWRRLDLPHDWAVEGPFDPNENISQGYRPRGISWYRRYLRVEESDRGRYFELQFDAIATHATVWVNGNVVKRNYSGYNASYIDITPYIRYGDAMNTIAVKVDATQMEGWWYEGAGMYRHTWLVKANPVHIVTDGLHATPRLESETLEGGKWSIPVEVTLNNSGENLQTVTVEVTVTAPNGKQVAKQSGNVTVPVLGEAVAKLPVTIQSPALWSHEQTNLYRVNAVVKHGKRVIDEIALSTGFRTVRFDSQQGFFLNDKHVKLQGVCIHQDHAGVGVAVPTSIWQYRLRRLKELGVNAIRFSHNAPAVEVLDLVDSMGFLVMDENRNFNPSPDYMQQLEWMVRRDRHHPGIILWSVFNEEPVQASEVGYQMVRRMVAAVKALDDTRPVTAAMNGGFFSDLNVSHAVDVLGANYQVPDYDRFHAARPEMPFTSSEDTSAFMMRGEFTTDYDKNLIASYDEDFAFWGNSHRDAWQAVATRDYVAGAFVWTGFDYRGEPTPLAWPSVSSFFGIMDLNGFAKTAYYIHRAQWVKDEPQAYLAPHWNWAGKEGQIIPVLVMANVDKVQLLLNGKSLGEQVVDPFQMNTFDVAYQPGKLEVIGYSSGKEVVRNSVETTGKAVAVQLVPDRKALVGDGFDAMPITVQAVDAKGRVVPTDNSLIHFEISGAGQSIGHGNGNPNSHEDEKGATRHLFNGLAQLIVQSHYESSGNITVKASSPGLKTAKVSIPVKKVAAVPYVASQTAPNVHLSDWRTSPVASQRPDPTQKVADNDMNSWGWGQPPFMSQAKGETAPARYRLYRTNFTPRKNLARGDGELFIGDVVGRVEVWLNDELLYKKDNVRKQNLRLPIPKGEGNRELTFLLEDEGQDNAVIGGPVIVQPKGKK